MIGESQKAILDWLKEHPQSTVSEVGDACYKISYYGRQGGAALPEHKRIRARWASKILIALKKRGLACYSDINNPKWFVNPPKDEVE
jgi:hypothetical protein